MMFNPYFARPIGSRRFEEHLITIATKNRILAQEEEELLRDMPVSMVAVQEPNNPEPIERGWRKLKMAVDTMGYLDFLDICMCSCGERMNRCEAFAEYMDEKEGDWIYKHLANVSKWNRPEATLVEKRLQKLLGQLLYGKDEKFVSGCGR